MHFFSLATGSFLIKWEHDGGWGSIYCQINHTQKLRKHDFAILSNLKKVEQILVRMVYLSMIIIKWTFLCKFQTWWFF